MKRNVTLLSATFLGTSIPCQGTGAYHLKNDISDFLQGN